ncbi:hypothetical protein PPACK8108_LOCUS21972 [Phakopsora pachyrhizi]|uniref:Uncharacterized protein n=1 Tax=Phakopsora pachyrhizi TaxID=170000 RepID=A0AAV0BJR5_PHAPC|nr:hypothetical protein PPACK8108_LOCUS21972 [Phakopsora pachyrhizi]
MQPFSPPASSSPTTRSDTLLPTLPTRIKSGSTENDIDRHQQEQNEGEDQEQKESQLCDGDDSILSNPFDDSDFELDEMENLKLKKGALDKFRLPIDVIEGSVGSLLLSSKFDLEEDEKRKQASKMEIRRSNGEAWLRSKPDTRPRINYKEWFLIPLVSQLDREIFECEALPRIWLLHPDNSISHEDSNGLNLLMIEDSGEGIGSKMMIEGGLEDLILLVIDLCQKILEEAKGDRDEDLISKLYLDSDIYHTYIQKKLTLAEVGSSSGRPRPACLPDPTKKHRISQTIDQELKLPKNKISSSGLDDQQTENATEETTLIPQIKKGRSRFRLWKDNLTIVVEPKLTTSYKERQTGRDG